MKKFSVIIAGQHTTSVSLEEEFFQEFCKIAKERKLSPNKLVTEIDKTRTTSNLSSAIRLFVLKTLQEKVN